MNWISTRWQKIAITVMITGMMVTPASGGYRALKRELAGYSPPGYLFQFDSAPANPTTSADQAFKTQIQHLNSMKHQWETHLADTPDQMQFVRFNPDTFARLGPVAQSDAETIRELANGFSLVTLEQLVEWRNPEIRSAKNQFRSTLAEFTQVSDLDEVLRQYSAFTEGLMTGIGPMKGREPIRMKFPFPGVTALKGQVVNQDVQVARQDVEIARRQAITGARIAYWNLVFNQEAESITRETVELFQRLESVAQTRYKAGKTSFQDVIKVSIQKQILEEKWITLNEERKNLESTIRQLLNLSPDAAIGTPEPRTPDSHLPPLNTLRPLAMSHRQELIKLRATIGKMERMIEMAETMILPAYTTNLSLNDDEAIFTTGSQAMKPAFSQTISASRGKGLPKQPWYGTNDGWLDQTRQKLLAMREKLKNAEATTHNMVRKAWFVMDKARRELTLYRDSLLDLSKSALSVSTRGYESGRVSFADVIGSYTNWLNIHLSVAEKKRDLGIANARLDEVLGISRKSVWIDRPPTTTQADRRGAEQTPPRNPDEAHTNEEVTQ